MYHNRRTTRPFREPTEILCTEAQQLIVLCPSMFFGLAECRREPVGKSAPPQAEADTNVENATFAERRPAKVEQRFDRTCGLGSEGAPEARYAP